MTTEAHATREDPGHAQTDIIVLGAAVASLAAVAVVLIQASSTKGATQDLLAGFGLLSIALSWCTVHTLFSLRCPTPAGDGNRTRPSPRDCTDFS